MANIEKIDSFMQHPGVPRSDHAFMHDLSVGRMTNMTYVGVVCCKTAGLTAFIKLNVDILMVVK